MNCMDCGGSECICRYRTDIDRLKRALLIVTRSYGKNGYIPSIGSPGCERIESLMRDAGVEPEHYDPCARLDSCGEPLGSVPDRQRSSDDE